MKREELEKNWEVSSYEENTEEQLDYYIDLANCKVGDKAYLYRHEEDELIEMEIVYIIWCYDDEEYYYGLGDDVLTEGEDEYKADTSAEFITDDDNCLVWFRYR